MGFNQIILRLTVLFSVFLTLHVTAQVSIPQVFQTSDNFDLFVKSSTNESKKELSDESKQSIHFDSFTPAFDESGQFKSITLEYYGGKQCVIQRVSGNEFVIQKGRKKLRKRRYTISLESGFTNSKKSIRLWNQTWSYIEQMAGITPLASSLF